MHRFACVVGLLLPQELRTHEVSYGRFVAVAKTISPERLFSRAYQLLRVDVEKMTILSDSIHQ